MLNNSMNFKEWLQLVERASSPGSRVGLYPMGYGGMGLYPSSDVINWASDAITYMSAKNRHLEFKWGKGILANPNPGEPLNFGKDFLPRIDTSLEFVWGKGMLAKPPELIEPKDVAF